MSAEDSNPYRAAGTFAGPSYTERQADRDLRRSIEQNQRYPYVLAPRQSGKSSLINQVRGVLSPPEFRTAFVDFSIFEPKNTGNLDAFQARFFADCHRSLGLPAPLATRDGFMDGIGQLLACCPGSRLVIFLDEVDALLPFPFKDTFFSILRNVFNERAQRPELKRIQFVLAGAARPEELITDRLRSPFNVGEAVMLNELSFAETARTCLPLAERVGVSPETVARAVFDQAGGSVYLTELILERLWERVCTENRAPVPPVELEAAIRKTIFKIVAGAPSDIHFRNIQAALHESKSGLRVYYRLLSGNQASPADRELLWFTGIATREGPQLYRNKIYQQVYGIHGSIDQETSWRRQRVARRVGSAFAVVAVIVGLAFLPSAREQRAIDFLAGEGFAWNNQTRQLIPVGMGKNIVTLDEVAAKLHALKPHAIDLSNCRALANVDGLKGLTTLRVIDLSGNPMLTNVNGLEGLTALQNLYLRFNPALTNVDSLKRLTSLKTLKLRGVPALANLEVIKGLTVLQNLYISDNVALTNADGLKGLTSLQFLELSDNPGLTNVDVLKHLSSLRTLILRGNHALLNVEIPPNLTFLRKLDLSNNPVLINLDSLKNLRLLETLGLSYNPALTSVEALKELTSLQTLDLSHNPALTSVDGLKNLTSLKTLYLINCNSLPKKSLPDLVSSLPNTRIIITEGKGKR